MLRYEISTAVKILTQVIVDWPAVEDLLFTPSSGQDVVVTPSENWPHRVIHGHLLSGKQPPPVGPAFLSGTARHGTACVN